MHIPEEELPKHCKFLRRENNKVVMAMIMEVDDDFDKRTYTDQLIDQRNKLKHQVAVLTKKLDERTLKNIFINWLIEWLAKKG